MEKKFAEYKADFKALSDEKMGLFEGFGSVFGNVDSHGDIVQKGAFSESLGRRGMPIMLWQHDQKEPIGKFISAKETPEGLHVTGELFIEDIPRARQAYRLLKEGAMKGLSIGFRTLEDDVDAEGNRTIKKVDLYEVSLVTFPSNELANVTAVKSDDTPPDNERDFEKFLRKNGYSRTAAKAITTHGIKGYENILREADVAKSCDALREADELKKKLVEIKQTLKEIENVRRRNEGSC